MNNEIKLSNDLHDIMKNFINLREFHNEEQKSRQELNHTLHKLKEEVQFVQAAERTERLKLNESRNLILQQQDTVNKLLAIKDENKILTERTKDLEKTVADLKTKLKTENTTWEQRLKDVRRDHTRQMEEVQQRLQKEVQIAKQELDVARVEFHVMQSESIKKLEDLQNNNTEEMNLTVQIYEEKVFKLETALAESRAENQQLMERASANISIYKKKVMELEQQASLPTEPSTVPPSPMRPQFQYHQPSNYGRTMCMSRLCEPIIPSRDVSSCTPYEADISIVSSVKKQPLDVTLNTTTKKKVMFPAVKKRKLFSNNDTNDLL